MTASSKLKGHWCWRLSSRTLTPSAVQTVTVYPMIVMFELVGSFAGGQRGKPVCWWNVSCRWWQRPCRKSAVELAASEADDATRWHWLPKGLDKLSWPTNFAPPAACWCCIATFRAADRMILTHFYWTQIVGKVLFVIYSDWLYV